ENTAAVGLRVLQVDQVGCHGEAGQLAASEIRQLLHQGQEAVLLGGGHDPLHQGGELADIVRPAEGPGAEGVGVGHRQVIDQYIAGGEADFHPATEGFDVRILCVVALGPGRVFHGADLVPQAHGVGAGGAFRGVGVHVVPAAVLQGDGEDV